MQLTNSNSSYDGEEPVEVDPSDSSIKQEMWMMGAGEAGEEEDLEEGEGEFVIPPEQYEQDMQAEDEQYIQAGTDGLSGQQVGEAPWTHCTPSLASNSWVQWDHRVT